MLQIQSCTHEIWPFSLEIDDFILRQCLIKLKNLDLLGHRLLTGHEIDSEVVKRKAAFLVRCGYKPIFSCWSVWPCWHFLIGLHWEWMSLQMPRHQPQLDYWGWFDVEVAMSTGVNALTGQECLPSVPSGISGLIPFPYLLSCFSAWPSCSVCVFC